jgi:hypothetical protein
LSENILAFADDADTVVIMSRQLTMRQSRTKRGATWVGVPALAGAVAALAIPGTTSAMSAEAALLAVGALALLAGHTWGLLVALSSHVPLVGRVWPALGSAGQPGSEMATGAVAVILVTAIPVIVLATLLFPRLTAHLAPNASPRVQSLLSAGLAVVLAASVILPAFV